ncbi:MAG: DNA adenine methylase, partial [Gammaproteobacteria bacterium]|nr:DNA adenine methylase [Gammaproteobacteria bacterium]
MNSPIRYYGGKGNLTQYLLPLIPSHRCYCEVFGGGASLLFAKPPSRVEVYNDIDSDVVAFFRMFHDPEAFEMFKRKCYYTPYSREICFEYRNTWKEQTDPTERIYRWFCVNRMMFGGRIRDSRKGGWSCSTTQGGRLKIIVDKLDEYVERLRDVQIDNRSWEVVLDVYDSPDTFFYLDPPYPVVTRTDANAYNYEMCSVGHERLIEAVR